MIEAVDAEPADEPSAHRTVMRTLLARLGLAYGVVWLPAGDGEFLLDCEDGARAPTMAAVWARAGCGSTTPAAWAVRPCGASSRSWPTERRRRRGRPGDRRARVVLRRRATADAGRVAGELGRGFAVAASEVKDLAREVLEEQVKMATAFERRG